MNRPWRRGAGVVAPVSSLPSRYGIGDFAAAARWLEWLTAAGMRYWQILPLTIPDSVGSPFASPSSQAMNPFLMSPDWLREAGLVTDADLRSARLSSDRIHLAHVIPAKDRLHRRAYAKWQTVAIATDRRALADWIKREKYWLELYSLYQAIKDAHHGQPWWDWPKYWRDPASAKQALTPALAAEREYIHWCQWMTERQWQRLHAIARRRGIKIIGDLPFYVQYDSVEVWGTSDNFILRPNKKLQVVSGSSPDVFSKAGQKWGTPVYRWSVQRRRRFDLWHNRVRRALDLYDIVRFDHFRGLIASWHVPVRAVDGRSGHWSATPGAEILARLTRAFGAHRIIAEDIGRITNSVIALRERFHILGSRVLQFAWSGLPDNFHEPRLVQRGMLYYTANHDTNTTQGWYDHEAKWYEKKHLQQYFGRVTNLPWLFVTTVMQHRAVIAMIHVADVWGLGQTARINHPGTTHRNWSWRMERWPTAAQAKRLRALALATKRVRPTRR